MNKAVGQFSAASSMAGYLYQCRAALLLGIEESRRFASLSLSIEKFDDVALENSSGVTSQFQLKHHGSGGNLTDASEDLWRTLRIWSAEVAANPQVPFERRFIILTTSTAPDGSIASKLRGDRSQSDVTDAVAALKNVASTSKNQDTKLARQAFHSLSNESQFSLVNSVYIYDKAPNLTDARAEIEDRLIFAVPQGLIEQLVDHLEGWWFAAVARSISNEASPPLSLIALRQKIDELAAAIRTGELLLHQNIEHVPNAALVEADTRVFVKQLRCIELQDSAIEIAKRDFYRAQTQRLAWARENALLDGEAQKYDDGLIEQWQKEKIALEEGADLSNDKAKKEFGRRLFHWANRASHPFRNRHENWLCSGSYQMLADVIKVGWHPDHKTLFKAPTSGEHK